MVGPDLSWCPVAMTGDQPASRDHQRCGVQVFRSLLYETTAAYRSPIGTNRPVSCFGAVSSVIAAAMMIWPMSRRIKVHFPSHHCDDLDRRNRQGGAEEERGDQALIGFGSMASGNSSPSTTPHRKGTLMPAMDTLSAARPAFFPQTGPFPSRSGAAASTRRA